MVQSAEGVVDVKHRFVGEELSQSQCLFLQPKRGFQFLPFQHSKGSPK